MVYTCSKKFIGLVQICSRKRRKWNASRARWQMTHCYEWRRTSQASYVTHGHDIIFFPGNFVFSTYTYAPKNICRGHFLRQLSVRNFSLTLWTYDQHTDFDWFISIRISVYVEIAAISYSSVCPLRPTAQDSISLSYASVMRISHMDSPISSTTTAPRQVLRNNSMRPTLTPLILQRFFIAHDLFTCHAVEERPGPST